MRGASRAWLAAFLLVGVSGCESAKITDVYMSRDEKGVRRTECFRPDWGHYFVIVEMFSASEDTLLTPYLRNADDGTGVPYISTSNDELAEFRNLAVGKNEEIIINLEFSAAEDPNDTTKLLPLDSGNFTWEFYLDDHDTPDDSITFSVSGNCPD
jgi:hypothetical protein